VSYLYQRREADLGGYHYQRREADLGALPLVRYRRGKIGAASRAIAERIFVRSRMKYARRDGTHPALRPLGTSHYTIGDCEELGFSLKPPKAVRRAAKSVGRFVKKHETALLIGAGVLTAGLLAPAAAVAVGQGALTAGKFLASGTGKLVSRFIPHGKAQGTPGTFPDDMPAPGTTPQPPIVQQAPPLPDLTMPASPGEVASSGGSSYGGGGGGAPVDPGDSPGRGESEAADQTEAPAAKPGLNPMLIVAGVALLGLATAGGHAAGRRSRG
jgi:hypothetical protein